MSNAPLTWAEAAKLAPSTLYRGIVNLFVDEYPFLAGIPITPWPGGKSYEYTQNQSLPTIAGVDETSTIESTKSVRRTLKCRLAQRGGQIENPVFLSSTMDNVLDQDAEAIQDLVRAYAIDRANLVINGAFNGAVTIDATGGTGGVDACTPGPRLDVLDGVGYIFFNDTGDYFSFKAPGDSDYGTPVAVAADGTYLLRSLNESLYVWVTIDISDAATNGNFTSTLTFTAAKSIDGLAKLCDPSQVWYGNGSATTPSTNGDAISGEGMDLLLDNVAGPHEELAFVCRKGIRRALKTILRGAGGSMVDEWMGMKLKRPQLAWEGVPIFADDRITKAETVGGSTWCTSVYLVRMNRQQGVGMFYGAQRGRGAMWSQDAVGADINVFGSPINFPVYLRGLPERDDTATEPVRLTSSDAMYCMATKAIASLRGISNVT